jgi:hypothetical protein
MKFTFTFMFVLLFAVAFSQWKRVEQLPAADISSLYRKDSVLYAGGKDKVYISKDKGQSWDSSALISFNGPVDAMIVYKNELFVASFGKHVFKSRNDGATWQDIGTGLFPFVQKFCEWRGNLYAATLGDGFYKLDSTRKDRWTPFNNGLSSLSANVNAVGANTHTMIGGTLANGILDRIADNSTQWEERLIINRIVPNGIVFDIIAAHDTLFLTSLPSSYMSTDNGITWNKIGSSISSNYTNLLNAKQAILGARNFFDGAKFNTTFFFLKKESLEAAFVAFSQVTDHFSYRMEIIGDKLWDASSHGLYFMSLTDLPGITAAEDEKDTVTVVGPGNPGNPGNPGEPVNPGGPGEPTHYTFSIGKVFPNPVAGEGHIALSLDAPKSVSAYIYDVTGKLVWAIANKQQMAAGNNILSFSMKNMQSGIYFIKLVIDGKVFTKEIFHGG